MVLLYCRYTACQNEAYRTRPRPSTTTPYTGSCRFIAAPPVLCTPGRDEPHLTITVLPTRSQPGRTPALHDCPQLPMPWLPYLAIPQRPDHKRPIPSFTAAPVLTARHRSPPLHTSPRDTKPELPLLVCA